MINPKTDKIFQLWLPFLHKQLNLQGKVDFGSPDCPELV